MSTDKSFIEAAQWYKLTVEELLTLKNIVLNDNAENNDKIRVYEVLHRQSFY